MAPHQPKADGPASEDRLIGETIGGRYRIESQLGQGGMGMVYRATHVGLEKAVALKFIVDKYSSDGDVVQRFHREAKAASRIGHDHIIDITDIGTTEDGRHFIAMELLQGNDLSELLKADGPFPTHRALRLISQVLYGLEAAHQKGIVHRDMKPENVFVTRHPQKGEQVKIMDFGISKIIDHHEAQVRLTETGAVIGTPIYMAPEQAQADPGMDHRVDLYAVGVMLYELLAGRPPFVAPTYLALVTKHIGDEPPPLTEFRPDLPPELVRAVHCALAKEPAQRFQTAGEFAAALPAADDVERNLSMQHTIPAVTKPVESQSPPSGGVQVAAAFAETGLSQLQGPRRSKKGLLAVLAVLAIGAGAAAFALTGSKKTDAEQAQAAETAPAAAATPADAATVAESADEPEQGTFECKTEPAGAEVYLDGRLKGSTPLTLEELPVGEHHLRLHLDGHDEINMEIEVRPGQLTLLHKDLVALEPDHKKGSRRDRNNVKRSGEPAGKSETPGSEPAPKDSKPTPKDTEPAAKKPGGKKPGGKKPGGKKPGGKKNPYL